MITPETTAITFDVGNTILFPRQSIGEHYARASLGHGIPLSVRQAEHRFTTAWRRAQSASEGLIYGTDHDQARAFWLTIIKDVCRTHYGPVTETQHTGILDDLYELFSRGETWRVDPAFDTVLQHCRTRGLRVGLVSNWDIRLRRLLEQLGLVDRVDAVVISAEVGIEKPDGGIFQVALEQLGVPASATAHVGDTWLDDVVGATKAGLQAIWLNTHGETRPGTETVAMEIPSLAHLAGLGEV